jgi:hypothetical protein
MAMMGFSICARQPIQPARCRELGRPSAALAS